MPQAPEMEAKLNITPQFDANEIIKSLETFKTDIETALSSQKMSDSFKKELAQLTKAFETAKKQAESLQKFWAEGIDPSQIKQYQNIYLAYKDSIKGLESELKSLNISARNSISDAIASSTEKAVTEAREQIDRLKKELDKIFRDAQISVKHSEGIIQDITNKRSSTLSGSSAYQEATESIDKKVDELTRKLNQSLEGVARRAGRPGSILTASEGQEFLRLWDLFQKKTEELTAAAANPKKILNEEEKKAVDEHKSNLEILQKEETAAQEQLKAAEQQLAAAQASKAVAEQISQSALDPNSVSSQRLLQAAQRYEAAGGASLPPSQAADILKSIMGDFAKTFNITTKDPQAAAAGAAKKLSQQISDELITIAKKTGTNADLIKGSSAPYRRIWEGNALVGTSGVALTNALVAAINQIRSSGTKLDTAETGLSKLIDNFASIVKSKELYQGKNGVWRNAAGVRMIPYDATQHEGYSPFVYGVSEHPTSVNPATRKYIYEHGGQQFIVDPTWAPRPDKKGHYKQPVYNAESDYRNSFAAVLQSLTERFQTALQSLSITPGQADAQIKSAQSKISGSRSSLETIRQMQEEERSKLAEITTEGKTQEQLLTEQIAIQNQLTPITQKILGPEGHGETKAIQTQLQTAQAAQESIHALIAKEGEAATEAEQKVSNLAAAQENLNTKRKEGQTATENNLRASRQLASSIEETRRNNMGLFRAQDDVNLSLKRTTAIAKSVGSQFDMISNRLSYMFSAYSIFMKIVREIKKTFQDIQQLDKAFGSIAMVTTKEVDELWASYGQYAAIANKLGQATTSAIQASALFYQQGLQDVEVMQLTESTMKLATLAQQDFSTATKELTAALRGFHMEMSEGEHITDVYSELAAHAAADVNLPFSVKIF